MPPSAGMWVEFRDLIITLEVQVLLRVVVLPAEDVHLIAHYRSRVVPPLLTGEGGRELEDRKERREVERRGQCSGVLWGGMGWAAGEMGIQAAR